MSKVKKDTNLYEAVFVFSLKNSEDEAKAEAERFKKLIEENATIEKVDEWGKRRLAYTIDYQDEGYYVLYKFEGPTSFITELNRVSNISESVVRSMCVLAYK